MAECPNCGKNTTIKILKVEYLENGWTIRALRKYKCEHCGARFNGHTYYKCADAVEWIGNVQVDEKP